MVIFESMKKLMEEDIIADFSILKSSLEQVFKNIVSGKYQKRDEVYIIETESEWLF